MHDPFCDATAQLERHFGFTAFRPLQGAIVRSVLARCDTLGVLPTGGGKSVCFQIPALVLGGWTLVVSPLIALMDDQVAAARRRGIAAASLAGSITKRDIAAALGAAARGELALLYVSPERLEVLVDRAGSVPSPVLLAVDEAHCISEWGHDFRPAFRRIGRARRALGNPPIVALTGSATPRVREDIAGVLALGRTGHRERRHVASFDRDNLRFEVVRVRNERDRFSAALASIADRTALAIVYAPTRRATESIAAALRRAGRRALAYHAGLDGAERAHRLSRFLGDGLGVVVATSAFGMGIDKPDVRTVVHWSMPATPESYYQEAGRAGRDGHAARCVLLFRPGDATIHRRQLEVTFPPRRTLERLWGGALERSRVPAGVWLSAERLRAELHPERGSVDWEHVARRRAAGVARLAAMESYAGARRCRRAALLGYFGESAAGCSGCDRCYSRTGRRLNPFIFRNLSAVLWHFRAPTNRA